MKMLEVKVGLHLRQKALEQKRGTRNLKAWLIACLVWNRVPKGQGSQSPGRQSWSSGVRVGLVLREPLHLGDRKFRTCAGTGLPVHFRNLIA